MAFSSSLPNGGGRVSPPSRGSRQVANAGVIPRDKVSRIVFLSILLAIYSGITLGLILWNSSQSSNPTAPDEVVGQLRDDSARSQLGPQAPAEAGVGGGGESDATGRWEDTGRRQPVSGQAAADGGGGGGTGGEETDAKALPPPNGSSELRSGRVGRGTTQHNPPKDDGVVHPGQVDSRVSASLQCNVVHTPVRCVSSLVCGLTFSCPRNGTWQSERFSLCCCVLCRLLFSWRCRVQVQYSMFILEPLPFASFWEDALRRARRALPPCVPTCSLEHCSWFVSTEKKCNCHSVTAWFCGVFAAYQVIYSSSLSTR